MAITHPQAIVASAALNKATQTYTPSNVGDLLILIVNIEGTGAGPAVTGVTDTGITPTNDPGEWTLVIAAPGAAAFGRQEMWMARAKSTSAGTVTVTYASAPGVTVELAIDSLSAGLGAATQWAAVAPAANPNAGTPTTITFPSVTSPGATPSAYYGLAACTGTGSAGATSGFTYQVTSQSNVAVYNLNCAAVTAEQPTATTTAAAYDSVAAIFFPTLPPPPPSAHGMSIAVGRGAIF